MATAGNNTAVPAGVTTDLAGLPRFIDGDLTGDNIVDMGAYEFNYASMGDFDYDRSVDFTDFAIFAMAWLTKPSDPQWNPVCDISPDNSIDALDLMIFANYWLEGL